MDQPALPPIPTDRRKLLEELAFAQQTLLERRQRDPLYLFQPHPKQRLFIDAVLRSSVSRNWLLAANRSGKTDAGSFCGASLARFGVEPKAATGTVQGAAITVKDRATSGWVSALDFPSARDVVQPKYFDNGFVPPSQAHAPFIPKYEILGFDKEAQILKLKNGSIIGFKSAESGRTKYQGAEKDWVHFDEAHPKDIYEECLIRVGTRPFRFFCTATILPEKGGEGISWIYHDIIAPWQEGRLKNVGLYNASIYDNPHIPRDEIALLETLYPPGSVQHRIRLGGELIPGIAGARVYINFQRQLHVRASPAMFPRRPLCWSWDFNVQPMTSIVGQRINGVFYAMHEFFQEESDIASMCEAFREKFSNHAAEIWLYGDATARKRSTQSHQSDYFLILNEMKGLPIRMKVPEANPPVNSRINAMNRALLNEHGEVCINIDPQCRELANDLDQVIFGGDNKIKKISNRADPYFWRTHISDALGYWIAFEAPVRPMRGGDEPFQEKGKTNIRRPGYNLGRGLIRANP